MWGYHQTEIGGRPRIGDAIFGIELIDIGLVETIQFHETDRLAAAIDALTLQGSDIIGIPDIRRRIALAAGICVQDRMSKSDRKVIQPDDRSDAPPSDDEFSATELPLTGA